MGVQSVAKTQGWQCLASSSHLGLGPVEPMGNASSCLLASPIGDRYCFKLIAILVLFNIILNYIF